MFLIPFLEQEECQRRDYRKTLIFGTIAAMFERLKTHIWAGALLRRAQSGGAFASVLYKGDPDAGAALVKLRCLDGSAILYWPAQDMDGARKWIPKGPMDEDDVDSAIAKRVDTDPDLWVIEIEDRQRRHFLTEDVEEQIS